MVGLHILQRTRQVDQRHVQAFAAIPVANVSDCMTRMTAGGARLRDARLKAIGCSATPR